MNLMLDDDNSIQYKFYEKPTARKLSLQADTVLSQNIIVQALGEDTKRRMLQGGLR